MQRCAIDGFDRVQIAILEDRCSKPFGPPSSPEELPGEKFARCESNVKRCMSRWSNPWSPLEKSTLNVEHASDKVHVELFRLEKVKVGHEQVHDEIVIFVKRSVGTTKDVSDSQG